MRSHIFWTWICKNQTLPQTITVMKSRHRFYTSSERSSHKENRNEKDKVSRYRLASLLNLQNTKALSALSRVSSHREAAKAIGVANHADNQDYSIIELFAVWLNSFKRRNKRWKEEKRWIKPALKKRVGPLKMNLQDRAMIPTLWSKKNKINKLMQFSNSLWHLQCSNCNHRWDNSHQCNCQRNSSCWCSDCLHSPHQSCTWKECGRWSLMPSLPWECNTRKGEGMILVKSWHREWRSSGEWYK